MPPPDPVDIRHRVFVSAVLGLAILSPFLWFFGPVLCTSQGFAFRDAAHYYYPLFNWTTRQWAAGQIPLWNPLENCGVPAAADPTASLFYPGKLLFALPLGFPVKYKLYITGHVFLASSDSQKPDRLRFPSASTSMNSGWSLRLTFW